MKLEHALQILDARKPKKPPTPIGSFEIKKVADRTLSYTERHRGQWFKPEYNLAEIQIAQDSDSFFARSVEKKVNRFMIAGWSFTGRTPEIVEYIEERISLMELSTDRPFKLLLRDLAHDMFRWYNHMWVKVRDPNSRYAKTRVDKRGVELYPVAGYFVLPFETLEFKTKPNGELLKVLQRMPSGEFKEFPAQDLIHFFANKKPGFAIGTPAVVPALDDIALLRRLEENVEELVETSLFPTYHYTIGTDEMPEMVTADGTKETDVIKRKIEYMPAGAVYVSDHRHKINVLGAEGKALRINDYLDYFKKRVFAALGVAAVDMGEGDSASRSTAGTLSKSLLQDVEAMQGIIKEFIDFYVVNELLLEGGFNPLDKDQKVEIVFGVVDREEQTKLENQTQQMMHGNLLTVGEARRRIGYLPYEEDDFEDTYQKLFAEPLAMLGVAAPNSAASEALAEAPLSNITPEGISKEQRAAKQAEAAKQSKPLKTNASSSNKQASSRANPSNQHGSRGSAKFSKDVAMLEEEWNLRGLGRTSDELLTIEKSFIEAVHALDREVEIRSQALLISQDTIRQNLMPRYEAIVREHLDWVNDAAMAAMDSK